MIIWDVSPVAVGPVAALGGLELRWYSLFFALGVVLYYFITRWLWKREKFTVGDFENLVLFLFVGLVVGARLGEVFFYQWGYYSSAGFWEIFKVWKGGLSSHGATIGLVAAYAAFWGRGKWRARRAGEMRGMADRPVLKNSTGSEKFKMGHELDTIAVCMPLVAGFVRLGNFFNSEIVGRATDSVFGVVFAQNGESFGRHPVQLYEGIWAWAVFAVVMGVWLKKRGGGGEGSGRGVEMRDGREACKCGIFAKPGFFLFLFIGLYFAGRFFIEFFKEYQIEVGTDGLPWGLTMGQGLSLIPIAIAVGYFVWLVKKIGSG